MLCCLVSAKWLQASYLTGNVLFRKEVDKLTSTVWHTQMVSPEGIHQRWLNVQIVAKSLHTVTTWNVTGLWPRLYIEDPTTTIFRNMAQRFEVLKLYQLHHLNMKMEITQLKCKLLPWLLDAILFRRRYAAAVWLIGLGRQ